MTQWFQQNFWWFVPGVVGPILIVLTHIARRKFSPKPPLRTWRERLDAAAKLLLVMFAFLLAYVAYSTHSYLAFALTIFMIFFLHAPEVLPRRTIPNWSRYVIYFGLFVVFLIIWEPPSSGGRQSSERANDKIARHSSVTIDQRM